MQQQTVKLIVHGERDVDVPLAMLDEARADHAGGGTGLDDLFQEEYRMVDLTVVVVEPNGTATELFRIPPVPPRRSLRGDRVTDAVTAVLEQAPRHPYCPSCGPRACPRHMAEAFVQACRIERLMVLPDDDGYDIVAAANRES